MIFHYPSPKHRLLSIIFLTIRHIDEEAQQLLTDYRDNRARKKMLDNKAIYKRFVVLKQRAKQKILDNKTIYKRFVVLNERAKQKMLDNKAI